MKQILSVFVVVAVTANYSVISSAFAATNGLKDPVLSCSNVTCSPGRECRVLSSGLPECVCRSRCPRRHHPICGSDGALYENHCDLHRHACIKGESIHPRYHDRSCREDPLSKLKHDIDKALDEIRERERDHIKVPRACHQNDRDRMREYLMSWMSLSANKSPWYKKGMSKSEIYQNYFTDIDEDTSKFIDSSEWLHYLRQKTSKSVKDKGSRRLRKLCIEALVEEADIDQDWRLTSQEFQRLMSEDYKPTNKYCVRDRQHYEDGTRTKVDCNGCTCACGKWICTSHPCSSGNSHFTSTEEYGNYEDMDNQID